MSVIQVPYTELYARANAIRQQAETIEREINNLNQVVSSLDWMGDRAKRFFNLWEQSRPEMQNWARIVRAFADDLEAQARRMEAADHR